MSALEHGSETLYAGADLCGHVRPDEPRSAAADWTAYEAWTEDHPNSAGPDGEPICLETPDGTFCPACTGNARDEEDLPEDEYVTCRLAGVKS